MIALELQKNTVVVATRFFYLFINHKCYSRHQTPVSQYTSSQLALSSAVAGSSSSLDLCALCYALHVTCYVVCCMLCCMLHVMLHVKCYVTPIRPGYTDSGCSCVITSFNQAKEVERGKSNHRHYTTRQASKPASRAARSSFRPMNTSLLVRGSSGTLAPHGSSGVPSSIMWTP